MKVLICSDTHRRHDNYLKVLEKDGPFDRMIHCGDTEGGESLISEAAGCPSEIVAGNNDFFGELPRECVFWLGGKKVWVTHGHNYYVAFDKKIIAEEARSRGMDVVMYGHTHRPEIEEQGVLCINPGSLSYPRQQGRQPSYIVLDIDEKGMWDLQIKYI